MGIVQAKFGSRKAKLIKNLLDKINDINHLKKIKAEAIKAKTLKDFVKSLKRSPKNKNSESK